MSRVRTVGRVSLLAALVSFCGAPGFADEPAANRAAIRIAAGIPDPWLRDLARRALEANPRVRVAAARARAARQRAPQVGALPDPVLGLTGYVSAPETRVGPQRAMLSLMQPLPWFGKRGLRVDAAALRADALDSWVAAEGLQLVGELRRLHHEIAFLDAERRLVELERDTLGRYEEMARGRYAAGIGLGQGVIRIQAEMTRATARLLTIEERRAALAAALTRELGEDAARVVPSFSLPERDVELPPIQTLRQWARELRPELRAADAEIRRGDALVALAAKAGSPDLRVGLTYTAVARRDDPAGLIEGNGRDVFGVTASFDLPFGRSRIRAALEEATETRLEAVGSRLDRLAALDAQLAELSSRVELAGERGRLLRGVLLVQAEESLRSAEAGYSAAELGALDLLDAERVVFDVRVAEERARADQALAWALLESAVGKPLAQGVEQ